MEVADMSRSWSHAWLTLALCAACAVVEPGEAVDSLPTFARADAGAPGRGALSVDAGPTHSDGGAKNDGGSVSDAGAPYDAGIPAPDAGAPQDAGVPGPDAGPPCVPTRTACNPALECGQIPDGCGGFLQCIG